MADGLKKRRTSKKRRIAEIMDAMYRLDAIYPQLREDDNCFASFIVMNWLVMADDRLHMLELKKLNQLFGPNLKLRRDDIDFVSDRMKQNPVELKHIEWIISFLGTSLTEQCKSDFVRKMWSVAYNDDELSRNEEQIIREISKLFGQCDQLCEQLRVEGRAQAA